MPPIRHRRSGDRSPWSREPPLRAAAGPSPTSAAKRKADAPFFMSPGVLPEGGRANCGFVFLLWLVFVILWSSFPLFPYFLLSLLSESVVVVVVAGMVIVGDVVGLIP